MFIDCPTIPSISCQDVPLPVGGQHDLTHEQQVKDMDLEKEWDPEIGFTSLRIRFTMYGGNIYR